MTLSQKPSGRQRQIFNPASSVRVLIVQILFSVAVCAGDICNKRNEQLMTRIWQKFGLKLYKSLIHDMGEV